MHWRVVNVCVSIMVVFCAQKCKVKLSWQMNYIKRCWNSVNATYVSHPIPFVNIGPSLQ